MRSATEWTRVLLWGIYVTTTDAASQAEEGANTQSNTGVGASVAGNVNTSGGDFAGRDINYQTTHVINNSVLIDNPVEAIRMQARLQQQVTLLAPILQRRAFEPETILIPTGPFWMGSDMVPIEMPRHEVVLPAYRIGKYPVTHTEYAHFLRHNPQHDPPRRAGWSLLRQPPRSKADHPVVGISWHEANAYCAWLRQVTERSYRLPSEAEWEKAARGTDGRRYPWGEAWVEGRCNIAASDTTQVGQFPTGASPYGCLDMLGNVQEWTHTLWGADPNQSDFLYPYHADDGREADGESPSLHLAYRIQRGGAFESSADTVRCSARKASLGDAAFLWCGFRVSIQIGDL